MGERRFITSPNGSLRKLSPCDIPDEALEHGKYLCFASIFVAPAFNARVLAQLFARARDKGLIICSDMTKCKNQETLADMKECLSYLDYLFPNYEEASLLTGLTGWDEIADAFLDCGVKHVIIKAGARGCFIKAEGIRAWVDACTDTECLDTTGAGDTFVAYFLYALNQGHSLRDCGEFANRGAALCISHIGATGNWVHHKTQFRT